MHGPQNILKKKVPVQVPFFCYIVIVVLILCLILKKNTVLLQLSGIRAVQLLMLLGLGYHCGKELFTISLLYCIF